MSTLRNAVQRRNHKERSQPLGRQKLGILEKHKDYALRSRDYNEKRNRLKVLRQKAAERNPDEFHFGMLNSQTDATGSKIADRGNTSISHSAARLLKMQDAGYLRTVAGKTSRDIGRLEEDIVINDFLSNERTRMVGSQKALARSSKTVFTDSKDAQVELRSRVGNPRNSPNENPKTAQVSDAADRKRRMRMRIWRKGKLESLKSRKGEVDAALLSVGTERDRMSSAAGGKAKEGQKFKIRDRKR